MPRSTHRIVLIAASGRERTERVEGTTDTRACNAALKRAHRDEPSQGWRVLRVHHV